MNKQEKHQFFERMIEQHKGILFKVARTYCPDTEDQEDLIQEMMIQIWQSIHNYNDQYKMSTWLYRISMNVAISFYRKRSTRVKRYADMREQTAETTLDTLDTMDAIDARDARDARDDKSEHERHLILLEQFIHQLKEIDKALMILYLEDKSHAEIAEILGISVSNVGTKIGRIKEQLKKRFSQLKS